MKRAFRYFLLALSLVVSMGVMAQSTRWRDIYTVKKKDTIFGIAKKYGLSLPELMDANPDMKKEGYTLKKGDTLFIPYEKDAPAAGAKASAPKAAPAGGTAVKVGIMLPLHDVDGDGRRMVEYYRGFLMACEQLKQKGVSTDVSAWNVPIDADIRQTLLEKGASECDIIFGPLYTKQVTPLAEFCKTHDIKMVIPFSITGDDVDRYKNIFQVYQSPTTLNDAAVKAFVTRFQNLHPVFVDCNDSTSKKGVFTMALRKELEKRKIKYNITNVSSDLSYFAKAFDRSRHNVVVLNSGRSPQLTQALNKLDALNAAYPGLVISLYGYTEWLMYAKYNLERFYKYDTYIPSTFYYNASSAKTIELESSYAKWFHQPMQSAMPRFAITGYDHAMFFIQGVRKYGKDFVGTRKQIGLTPVQTPLNFIRTAKGGFRNSNFQLIHYTFNHQVESITY